MMGLRLTRGLAAEDFTGATGMALFDFLDTDRLRALAEGGFLATDEMGVKATPEGMKRLDAVLAHLLT